MLALGAVCLHFGWNGTFPVVTDCWMINIVFGRRQKAAVATQPLMASACCQRLQQLPPAEHSCIMYVHPARLSSCIASRGRAGSCVGTPPFATAALHGAHSRVRNHSCPCDTEQPHTTWRVHLVCRCLQDFAKLPWELDMPHDKAAAVLGSHLGVHNLEPASVLDLDVEQITGVAVPPLVVTTPDKK